MTTSGRVTAYARLATRLARGDSVLLDGGVGSEIALRDARDTWAIYDETAHVLDVHRQYAQSGCDVVSTNTWGLLGSIVTDRGRRPGRTGLPAWTVATRDAVKLARRGIALAGRTGECAVAFSLNDADPLLAGEQVLLPLLWSVDPPDLVLVETLTTLPSPELLRAIAQVASSGLPVWVSFRRVVASPEETPGSFRSALGALEGAGVQAVLLNCIPVERATEAVTELAASTTLPIGCYPRLDAPLDPQEYGERCLDWHAAGARIIGGCCGVGPGHIRSVRDRLAQSAGAT
jgi:S-methylmethionine-dependent homocysteine/selenocysteine methylase